VTEELDPKILAQALKLSEELNRSAEKRLAIIEANKDEIAEELKIIEKRLKYENDIGSQLGVHKEIQQKELEIAKVLIREAKTRLELGKITAKEFVNIRRENEEILELVQEQSSALDGYVSKLSSAVSRFTGITGEAETMAGHMLKLVNSGEKFSISMAATLVTLKKQVSPINIATAGIDTMVQSSLMLLAAQEEALASFNKVTGAAGKYNKMIVEMERSNSQFGVSTADSAYAVQALFTGMTAFTNLSSDAAAQLAKTTAMLDKLGVDAATTAANLNVATRALGMTVTEAEVLQRELFATAEALALPPAAIAEGFAKAAPQLAQHGASMVKVFKELAIDAKQTGVAIDALIAITSQMNTFEGAADAAGKLNAILGGDLLNSVDLLTASEDERLKMVQDSIKLSGRQWTEMNKFEKMAVASAAGINDMAQAAAIFNPLMIGMTEAQKEAAKSQAELAANAKSVQTIFAQLQSVMSRFAVSLRPLVEGMKFILDGILKLSDMTGGILMPALVGLFALFVVGTKLAALFGTVGLGPLAVGGTAAGAGATAAAGGVSALGAAATATAPGLLSLGASMLLIGGGIALIGVGVWVAAKGVGSLISEIAKLSPSQLFASAAALSAFTTSILAMGAIALVAPLVVGVLLAMSAFNATLHGVDFSSAVAGYRKIANEINNIVESIERMPLTKAMTFSYLVGAPALAGAVPATAGATSSSQMATATSGLERMSSANAKQASLNNSMNRRAPEQAPPPQIIIKPNIKLVIDRKEIGRVLDPEIRSRIKANERVIAGRAVRSPLE